MKSLSYFLIALILFKISIYCSIFENAKFSEKNPTDKNKKNPSKVKIEKGAQVQKIKEDIELKEANKLLCGYGDSLGILKPKTYCEDVHKTKCKVMIKRKKNLPISTPKQIKNKGKKIWTQKERMKRLKIAKYNKQKKHQNNIKNGEKNLSKREKEKKIEKNKAKKLIDKVLESKSGSKLSVKTIKNIAKNIITGKDDNTNNKKVKIKSSKDNLKKVRKSGKSIKKKEVIKKPETGNFCVHALTWNLQYCCYFNSRNDAQEFANTQLPEKKFNELLAKSESAERKDIERKKKKSIPKVKKVKVKNSKKANDIIKVRKNEQTKKNAGKKA